MRVPHWLPLGMISIDGVSPFLLVLFLFFRFSPSINLLWSYAVYPCICIQMKDDCKFLPCKWVCTYLLYFSSSFVLKIVKSFGFTYLLDFEMWFTSWALDYYSGDWGVITWLVLVFWCFLLAMLCWHFCLSITNSHHYRQLRLLLGLFPVYLMLLRFDPINI